MIQEIIDYIEENGLNVASQKRAIAYRRFYLINLLRDQGLTLSATGKIFNRDHATALHGIKMHNNFMSLRDPLYMMYIKKELDTFEPMKEYKRDIFEDVLRANNTTDLKLIKQRIADNEYY